MTPYTIKQTQTPGDNLLGMQPYPKPTSPHQPHSSLRPDLDSSQSQPPRPHPSSDKTKAPAPAAPQHIDYTLSFNCIPEHHREKFRHHILTSNRKKSSPRGCCKSRFHHTQHPIFPIIAHKSLNATLSLFVSLLHVISLILCPSIVYQAHTP